ncbi:MAG: leucine-rich repeat domain-containing protein [Candidatus Pacebacteria bacterium]|nr:leucine-rich repeat domain-containing protein [Candidatus Paceibacterota bacterium]MCF7857360.1 leucine-rich repeat domain-containing protein [Candidatus Paceibacterota bacterium]
MNIIFLIIVFLLGVGTYAGVNYLNDKNPVDSSIDTVEMIPSEKADIKVAEPAEETKTTVSKGSPTIDLSNQGLVKVQGSIFDKINTEVLNLSNNNLSGSLSSEIGHLKNLRILDLSNNNFTGVPAEIGQLSNLEVLDLSGNPITGLPYELGNLKNLKILDLRNTNYSEQDLTVIKAGLPQNIEILK